MCEIKILSKRNGTVVSQCKHCLTINIWHKNILLNFSPQQFKIFKRNVLDINFDENCFLFPSGESRAVLTTPYHDISFTFAKNELEEFYNALAEADLLSEVLKLLNVN